MLVKSYNKPLTLIGGGKFSQQIFSKCLRIAPTLIAVDSGLNHLDIKKSIPKWVIGDLDSAKKNKTPVYVATNLLESMIINYEPTRAESNDIYSSLKSGCAGLVLAAETAIGKNPVLCVEFLKKCIKVYLESLQEKIKLF